MITFGWDLCYVCNYRCPYCGIWENASKDDVVMPVSGWEKVWAGLYAKYGRCRIFVSGGEPSVYPDFFNLIKMLARMHHPDICTNLSWDVSELVLDINSGDLGISPTYHPTFADFNEFFEKAVRVKEYLPDDQVYYVANPGQIEEMPERSRRLKKAGIKLIPLPLRGEGYMINTEEEKKIIEEVSPYKGSEKLAYQFQDKSPRGKLCRAGQEYAVIRVSGRVDRCSQYDDNAVGSIKEEGFSLFDAPEKCAKDYCPIESQWIIEDA